MNHTGKRPRNPVLLAALIVGLLAFAALSFGPCVDTERTATLLPFSEGEPVTEHGKTGYFPLFCCVLTAIELGLLPFRGAGFRVLGLILTGMKLALPLPLMGVLEALFLNTGEVGRQFTRNGLGTVLLALGGVVLLLYLAALWADPRRSRGSAA